MHGTIPPTARWRKSSRSGTGENCVELARGAHHAAVRDSKNPGGGALALPVTALVAVLAAADAGELDRA